MRVLILLLTWPLRFVLGLMIALSAWFFLIFPSLFHKIESYGMNMMKLIPD